MEHWEGHEFKMFEPVSYLVWEELSFHRLHLFVFLLMSHACFFSVVIDQQCSESCRTRTCIIGDEWYDYRVGEFQEAKTVVKTVDRAVVVARFSWDMSIFLHMNMSYSCNRIPVVFSQAFGICIFPWYSLLWICFCYHMSPDIFLVNSLIFAFVSICPVT
jgi:hypothetical protein